MKNLLTFVLTLSVLISLSGASAWAQGRGLGNGPSVSQGHGQSVGHDQVKNGSDPNGNHDSRTDWQTKFNERFQSDPTFATNIKNLLGSGTTDAQVQAAMMGFKNRGQFIGRDECCQESRYSV